MKRNLLTSLLASLLALAVFAGTWHLVQAAVITQTGYIYGRQGIFVPEGFSPDNIIVERIGKGQVGGAPAKFVRPILHVQYKSNTGSTVSTPFALTYVFFNLHGYERADWERGRLNIYYKDLSDGSWKTCNAYLVDGGQSQPKSDGEKKSEKKKDNTEDTSTKTYGRLVCVVTQGTYYGLGKSQSDGS